ncbi:MAG: response regulator [Myxococcaceae bacterium]
MSSLRDHQQGPEYILVVEDDPDLADLELMVLRAAGYQARSASNGAEALDAVAQQTPSLILLDMLMPVMDGWRFARAFRAGYGRDTPIVVITAAEHAEQRAAEVGAQAVLAKPFELDELLRAVARFLASDQTSADHAQHP